MTTQTQHEPGQRPETIHILTVAPGRVVGWTDDSDWAHRWAAQLYGRAVMLNVKELVPAADRQQQQGGRDL